MLYVNEELINTRNRKPEYDHAGIVTDYYKTIKDIREYYGDFLVIETKLRPRSDPKTHAPRFPGPRGLLLRSTINFKNKDGEVSTIELMYSPTVLQEKEGRLILENPNMLITRGAHTIDVNKNPDLAYYIVRCGKVGRTPAEGKKFHIFDVVATNKQNASRRRTEGAVLNLIYSSIPENKLRTLAKSFGVGDVNLKDIETIREGLFQRLQDAEDLRKVRPDSDVRGFKEFIESAEVRFHDQITALCRDAEEANKLVYQEDDRRWVIDYQDGAQPYVLKDMSGGEYGDPLGTLVAFLITETNMLRKLENVMGIGKLVQDTATVRSTDVPKLTPEMILTEHKVPVLKKWLRELDPTAQIAKNAKGEELRILLLSKVPTENVQETVR